MSDASSSWKGSGRRPSWPPVWIALAAKVGGSKALRLDIFGYRSKTTLSDKILGRSPWSKADRTILGFLAKKHGLPLADLLKQARSWEKTPCPAQEKV